MLAVAYETRATWMSLREMLGARGRPNARTLILSPSMLYGIQSVPPHLPYCQDSTLNKVCNETIRA